MSILLALALAAAPAAQAARAASADHSKHAQHQQQGQHQQHAQHAEMMKHCHDMMAKMHQGMKHDGHKAGDAKPGADHQDHSGH